MTVYTVGYEGAYIEEFTEFLRQNKIKIVADVRKNPVSRKKGFSKHKMAGALSLKKITYVHLPELGVPTEWRKQAKAGTLSRKKMFKDYTLKILPKATGRILELIHKASTKNLVLLCYEADPTDCHRSFVAKEMQKHSTKTIKVMNLTVPPDSGLFRKSTLKAK